jgi:hypothetical protein
VKQLKKALTKQIAVAVTGIALLPACAIYYHTAKNRAVEASESLASCQELAAQIRQLQQHTEHASLTQRSLTDLADLVEHAAATAGLPRDSIVRVDPEAIRRVGESDYREQATEIELGSVALDQVRQLIDGLSAHDSNLEVRTLRLRTPHEEANDGAEKWLSELVLTQRIYAPKSSGP